MRHLHFLRFYLVIIYVFKPQKILAILNGKKNY